MTRYFHSTTWEAVVGILLNGFNNGHGQVIGGIELVGVWLADRPLSGNEGCKGDDLLSIDLPDDLDLDEYELVEEGKPYREWCVPAAIVNTGVVEHHGYAPAYEEDSP